MRIAALMLLGLLAAPAVRADSNPMQPGTWEFTRSGGMAANLIGRFCITAADIADPLSPVNGFLSREDKTRCKDWKIEWHGSRAEYSGACQLGGKSAEVSGRIVADAGNYSDTQNVKQDGNTAISPILDIINGLRLGACAN
ncbi:MAG: DUF3617 family protein [Betaproteobacteria bacterium]